MNKILNIFIENQDVLLPILYTLISVFLAELLARVPKTSKSYSPLRRFVALVDAFLPDRNSKGAQIPFEVDIDSDDANSELNGQLEQYKNTPLTKEEKKFRRRERMRKALPIIGNILSIFFCLVVFTNTTTATTLINLDAYIGQPISNTYITEPLNALGSAAGGFQQFDNYKLAANDGKYTVSISFDSAEDSVFVIKCAALSSCGIKAGISFSGTDTGFITLRDVIVNNSVTVLNSLGIITTDTITTGAAVSGSYSYFGNGIKITFDNGDMGSNDNFLLVLVFQKSNACGFGGLEVTGEPCCPETNVLLNTINSNIDQTNINVQDVAAWSEMIFSNTDTIKAIAQKQDTISITLVYCGETASFNASGLTTQLQADIDDIVNVQGGIIVNVEVSLAYDVGDSQEFTNYCIFYRPKE